MTPSAMAPRRGHASPQSKRRHGCGRAGGAAHSLSDDDLGFRGDVPGPFPRAAAGRMKRSAMCKKCGAKKRRWPRSCARCRSGSSDQGDTALEAAELAVETGLLGWIGRGLMGVARLVLRTIG